MTAYLDNSIDSKNYQENRITYPNSLYEAIVEYHAGGRKLAVDVGCGTGIGTLPLLKYFDKVVGCDPSEKMLQTAREVVDKIPNSEEKRVEFKKVRAEALDECFGENTVDLVVAGESVQYTAFDRFFEQVHKVLKPGGTLSYWFYCDPVFIDYPRANEIFRHSVYEDEQSFGSLWPSEMKYVRKLGSNIGIPDDKSEHIQSETYVPLKSMKPGKFFIYKNDFTLKRLRNIMSTWSVYQTWLDNNEGSTRDIIDHVVEKIKLDCNLSDDAKLRVEWETAFYIARNKG
ncbi:hypothetical protein HG535_0C06500 [Zygotorulaspora mrakii]|uniref:Methyltransferase type 11 domain-containing protein n=1 Tax=Zygotorulaspora mrakii TaxID=42260 RepID=A0A7H9B0T7_ZYGMR|nr:uncharacterized protein HG535_0C06500 [Zygotorulaspora mrakii]QLG72295.1 hypothetical protein HG535_0C06500 [Zygotorulaspora mrakii]